MIPPCLTLGNIRYVSRVKWRNLGKGVAPSPTPQCSSYWKGSLLVALDYSCQLYFYFYLLWVRVINFFQAVFMLILLDGCTTWRLTKCIEKKLDCNCTRMLRAILNKSWKQHLTKQQLYSHLPPISKTIQIRWIRYAGHCRRSKDELISDVLQ